MTLLSLLAACGSAPEAPLPVPMAPCPDSPNCVSSMAPDDDEEHYIDGFHYSAPQAGLRGPPSGALTTESSPDATLHQLGRKRLFESMEGVTVRGFSTASEWKRLIEVVDAMPRSEIVTQSDNYVHFVFTTALFRFRDDVEFKLEPSSGTIHVRSASRVGHSDLGVNRKRVEQIRQALE